MIGVSYFFPFDSTAQVSWYTIRYPTCLLFFKGYKRTHPLQISSNLDPVPASKKRDLHWHSYGWRGHSFPSAYGVPLTNLHIHLPSYFMKETFHKFIATKRSPCTTCQFNSTTSISGQTQSSCRADMAWVCLWHRCKLCLKNRFNQIWL